MKLNNIDISKELKLLLLLVKREAVFNIEGYLEKPKIYNNIYEGIDWEQFFRYAYIHGLISLVYTSISQINNDKIPDWLINRLKMERKKRKIETMLLSIEVTRICKMFESNNIRFFILKGIPLALTIYKNVTLRESSDIDFFVHRDDLNRTIKLIDKEGFVPLDDEYKDVLKNISENNEKYLFKYHHMDYIHPTRGIRLEFHWKLCKSFFFIMLNDSANIFSFDNLWLNKNEIIFSSNKLYKFCLEDELLYLIYHATTHTYMRLKWLLDIYELLTKYKEIKWNELIFKAQKASLLKALAQAMILCSIYFDLDIEKLKKTVESNDLNEAIESKKIIRSTHVFCEFILPNIFKLYNSEGTILFKLRKRINYTLWKITFNNEEKKVLILLNDIKVFVLDMLKKVNLVLK